MKTTTLLALGALTATLSFGVFAQGQTETPLVDKRQKIQKARIKQGIESGELTKKEAARLKAEQAKIRWDEKKAEADGLVTAKERANLHRELNKASKDIHKQRKDDQKRE
ncbi:MAG: hypothetical protein HY695_06355 [Deltaproteobacteria bacterium]|nr:hypothetical protein [Deltaproteobacteria bacterium]